MLNKIEQWIDQTNASYSKQRICCDRFTEDFKGFYSVPFLKQSYYVVVDKIPKPDFPELREIGFDDFLDMDVDGITYKDTYYVRPHTANDLKLHFHELVHVAQWNHLGAKPFIERYINEIKVEGYKDAPLEIMAYSFGDHYSTGGGKIDVPTYVSTNI